MNGQDHTVGTRILRGLIVIAVGLIIWFLPIPAGVKKEAWHLLAIFVATIFGLILTPLPMGGSSNYWGHDDGADWDSQSYPIPLWLC